MTSETGELHPVMPVLDLMIGQVVLAQGGDRGNYTPVHSRLTHSSHPLQVAKSLFHQSGSRHLYLADIDSFAGANPNWDVYNQLLEFGFELSVDADWLTNHRFKTVLQKLKNPKQFEIIVSTETLTSAVEFEVLKELRQDGLEVVFSLDLNSGRPITKKGDLEQAEPMDLIELAIESGVSRMIFLDLSKVGTYEGRPDTGQGVANLISNVRKKYPDVSIVSGGGVRNVEDIQAFLDLGCHQVLVASAIHDCRITPFDVANLYCQNSS
ncbi:MAG: HisA/HisF-related TIM barrel protein [Planctomycetota bacterium]